MLPAILYWQQGRSTENDFIYVTTQTLTRDHLATLSDEVGEKRSSAGLLRGLPRQGRCLPEPDAQERFPLPSCTSASGAMTTTA